MKGSSLEHASFESSALFWSRETATHPSPCVFTLAHLALRTLRVTAHQPNADTHPTSVPEVQKLPVAPIWAAAKKITKNHRVGNM